MSRCFVVVVGIVVMLQIVNEQVNAVLTQAEKVGILAVFNRARATTVVSAANMKMLVWDDAIAAQMQNYTDGCVVNGPVAENPVSYFAYRDSASSPIVVAEYRTLYDGPYYDYQTGLCVNTTEAKKKCEFPEIYERLMVATIERVGCGMTSCGKKITLGPTGIFDACAIGGTQNTNLQYPWIAGTRCSQCPEGFNYCINGLCSRIPATSKPTKSPVTSKPSRTPTRYPTKKPTTRKPSRGPTRYPTKKSG